MVSTPPQLQEICCSGDPDSGTDPVDTEGESARRHSARVSDLEPFRLAS